MVAEILGDQTLKEVDLTDQREKSKSREKEESRN